MRPCGAGSGRNGPSVIVDARRRQAGKLRTAVRNASRNYARGLGVELTRDLLVVVQKVVHGERQLNALLQAFDGSAQRRRYVIYLALSVSGRAVAEDELLSALRHQLAHVLGDAIGKPVLTCAARPRSAAGCAPAVRLSS